VLLCRQRFEVGNDGFGICLGHVVGVHGRTKNLTLRVDSFFKDSLHFHVRETRQTCKRGNVIRPIGYGTHRHDPDGRALQPRVRVEVTRGVQRSVALGTFRHFLDKVFSSSRKQIS
jgi:hypothetical protein